MGQFLCLLALIVFRDILIKLITQGSDEPYLAGPCTTPVLANSCTKRVVSSFNLAR